MIKSELAIFLIVGLFTVAIDFSIYCGLIYLGVDSVNIAKGLGFIGGTFFSYLANRFLTFKEQDTLTGSVGRFAMVYIIGLSVNISVNYLSILTLYHFTNLIDHQQAIFLAFLLATGISAALNFLGMKFFVFTNHTNPPPSFLF
jgi:putative flippase GtrA